jgi:hypothetical protein
MEDTLLRERRIRFRDELIQVLRKELIGPEIPFGGLPEGMPPPTEILVESPVQRYSAGVLFPARQPINEVEDYSDDGEDLSPASNPEIFPERQADTQDKTVGEDQLGDAYDETVRLANEFFPSALGLTFIAAVPEKGLIIRPRAAVYEPRPPAGPASKLREWHRTQLDLKPVPLVVDPGQINGMAESEVAENLIVR